MAILMAFDTVFEQCSLAIVQDGVLVYEYTFEGGRGQTEIILPMVDKALSDTHLSLSQIDCLGFNRGPGAFSGIRINTAVVQALSTALDIPCVGVSSLHALADGVHQKQNYADHTQISAVMDARQNQVYVGQFVVCEGAVLPNNLTNEFLADYDTQIISDVITGDGAILISSNPKSQIISLQPTAADIARLAWTEFLADKTTSAEYALPIYLRDNAWKTLEQQTQKNG